MAIEQLIIESHFQDLEREILEVFVYRPEGPLKSAA
jgi:hypothetical protein